MPASQTTASTGPPIRALIVDNDEAHAETMADSLTRVGYQCIVATTGAAGAEMLEKDAFEIVVSDLKMPDVGGLEILAKCKEVLPDTPQLQAHFGQPGKQKPGCGFPVAHGLVMMHAGTGLP